MQAKIHLEKIEEVLQRQKDVGIRVNASKSKFCRTDLTASNQLVFPAVPAEVRACVGEN